MGPYARAAANFPSVTTDASGNVPTTWVYWKCGDENFTGFGAGYPPLAANQAYLTVSLQTPTGGGTYNGTATKIVTILDTKTEGAWVHNGVATGLQQPSEPTPSNLTTLLSVLAPEDRGKRPRR